MPLDVRLPIGGLFVSVGLLLLGYGALVEGWRTGSGQLNASWGALLLVFGLAIGYYGVRSERRIRRSAGQDASRGP